MPGTRCARRALPLLCAFALATACQNHGDRGDRGGAAAGVSEAAVAGHYADLVRATYDDSAAAARTLRDVIRAFVARPSAAGLAAARTAWLTARRPYLQSEAFRFYEGPIDAVEPLINAWPIDERYLDAVSGDARAGIINQTEAHPRLTFDLLAALNEKDGEKNISTGWHAIEFLLWGEDTRRDGPGQRPHTDYLPPAPGARRRGVCLMLLADGLVKKLEALVAAWSPAPAGQPPSYRDGFLARPPREAIALVVRGVGSLGGPELAGERLTVAYETKDQENEHSCFSDNTHEDLIWDIVGMRNVCTGRYQRADGGVLAGPGLCALVTTHAGPLGAALTADLDAALGAARALPAPFDQAIMGKDAAPGRIAVKRLITTLEAATATLARVAAALSIPLSLPTLAKGAR